MTYLVEVTAVQCAVREYLVHESSEIAQHVEQIIAAVPPALAAAVPADLAEAGKRAAYIANECQQAADVMADTGTFPTGQAIFRDASAQITSLLARIAAMEAQIKEFQEKADKNE